MNWWSLQWGIFTQRSAVEASEILTWDSSLFHEVTHELWLCEEDVVELVHTELEDLVDVLPAIQILVEGLYFTCKSEKDTNIIRCAFTRHYHQSVVSGDINKRAEILYLHRVFPRSRWARWGCLRCRWSPERVRGRDHQARWYRCSSLPPTVARLAARRLAGSLRSLLLGGQTVERQIDIFSNVSLCQGNVSWLHLIPHV